MDDRSADKNERLFKQALERRQNLHCEPVGEDPSESIVPIAPNTYWLARELAGISRTQHTFAGARYRSVSVYECVDDEDSLIVLDPEDNAYAELPRTLDGWKAQFDALGNIRDCWFRIDVSIGATTGGFMQHDDAAGGEIRATADRQRIVVPLRGSLERAGDEATVVISIAEPGREPTDGREICVRTFRVMPR